MPINEVGMLDRVKIIRTSMLHHMYTDGRGQGEFLCSFLCSAFAADL